MSIARTLLASFALLPLLTACQVYTGKPEGPPPATRLQGQLQAQGGQLFFTPCQEQRRFTLVDSGNSGVIREAGQLLADGQATLFAGLAGRLGGSQGNGSDGRFEVSQLYRVQGEGHGCDDLNFKRLTLRASGSEPFWQVEVGSKGLVLNRPGEQPLALPSSSGKMSSNIAAASRRSLARLMKPFRPWNGVSHTATTGRPPIESTRAWIRSETKMSGTK